MRELFYNEKTDEWEIRSEGSKYTIEILFESEEDRILFENYMASGRLAEDFKRFKEA